MTNAAAMLVKSAIACFFLLVGCASVYGQGTMGQVADPMNSKQLAKYLKRYVKPTFEQWIVIEDVHDDYLEKFSALRDGPITDFLEETQALNSSGGMPDIEAARKYVVSQEKISARIRRLDEQCFNSMVEVLREDQIGGLQRARLARERARLQSGVVAQTFDPMGADIWWDIEMVDLEEDESAVFLVRLQTYEASATRILGKGSDAAASMLLRIVEEIQARGFGDIDFSNPENMTPEIMQGIMEAYREGYKAALEESGAAATQFKALNYRTLRELTHAIDPWKTRQIKRNYLMRYGMGMSYGMTSSTPIPVNDMEELPEFEVLIEGLRGKDELLGDLRDPFNELVLAYVLEDHIRLDRILKIMSEFDLVLAQLDEAGEAFGAEKPEDDGEPSIAEQIAEIEAARNKAGKEHVLQLYALIEAEGSPQLKDAVKEPWGLAKYGDAPEVGQEQTLDIYVEEESDSIGSTEVVMTTGLEVERRGWTSDAMGIGILGKIRRRVGEEVWVQALIEALHEEYLEQWESQVAPLRDQLQKAESEVYLWDFETETGEYNEAAFKRQYELRAQLLETTASVDELFFENLVLTMPDEAAEAMRVLRVERTFDRSLGGSVSGVSPFPGMSGAGYANPIEVLNNMDLSAEDRLQVDQAILATQKELIDTQRALQNAQFAVERTMAENQFASNQADLEIAQEDAMAAMMEYQRLRRESLETIKPHKEEAQKKRDALFQRVSQSVSEETNQQFIEAYRIASHPSVYRDVNSVKPAIEGALRLADLSPEQEERLQELLGQYEADWLMRSHRMAEAQVGFADGDFRTPDGQQAWMAANMKLERARFDRDELAARTLRRLARILHAEQRRYIHALRGIEDEIGEDSVGSREATVTVE